MLLEVREKIESEQEQRSYLETFQNEMKEYENYARRSFLEKVFSGVFSVQQIYEEAAKISLDLDGPCYNLALLNLQVKRQNPEYAMQEPEGVGEVREALFRYFLRFPKYLIFQWNISLYGVLIKGEADQMEELKEQCIYNIEKSALNKYFHWSGAWQWESQWNGFRCCQSVMQKSIISLRTAFLTH